ncbi:energy transducer TonB [Novosphingobium ovatum]|nr:energy transducer TonB [Novosphingobium ovatum]
MLAPAAAMADTPDWQRAVARALAAKQTYPTTAQMRGEEGTAKVRIFVGADGKVQKAELVSGSGSATLDKEAMAMPARAGQLPVPPGGAAAVIVPVTWKLL